MPLNDSIFNHALDSGSRAYFIPQFSQPPYYDRVHSPSSHPLQAQIPGAPPPAPVFSYFSIPSQVLGMWQTHIPSVQHNPYPPPPPPQLVHKVWILDCRSCGTFLTNRGMKAVLLLRPNVSLFSTDALPINCSAYSTNPDALRPPPCRPSTSALPTRTCECLTQTLCCHTCGTAVGYMIVIPCSRCTSSITATNRATNGHRFVFHSSAIIASERHHVPEEPGVIPIEHLIPPPSSPPPLAPAYLAIYHSAADVPAGHRRIGTSFQSQTLSPPPPTLSSSPGSEYPPSPPTGPPESAPSSVLSSPDPFASITSTSPRPLLRSPSPRISAPQPHLFQLGSRSSTPEASHLKLEAGDVLYWHHLSKTGEIPGVEEDPRARVQNRRGFQFLDR
ncbi:hypothetical protein PAXRUDRAFT_136434 [Paxillus rubicundulus Ve08.2h10]|uniref:Protein FAM72 n=1 Tax=Paxillus rubicundulus Ve08.2h10 TaxID=930991 RepID=A0A0D0E147_9AGAM|nr:hypothetical protein PAXRUDRAFT_136434 [Paxillus rubicundulus Ve08.2h10]